MSDAEADKLTEDFEKWDARAAKCGFVARMERKLSRKERAGRY